MCAHLHASRLTRLAERVKDQARIHRMILVRLQRQPHRWCQRRLALACLAGTQPGDSQPERAAEVKLALELACVILVARQQQRARSSQTDAEAARRLQLR